MPRYVAFLRGINVGGHRIKMDVLRAHFEEMGFDSVSTFIASGNVIFKSGDTSTADLEERIASHLEEELGYEVPTFLRAPEELSAIAKYSEGPEAPSMYVVFLREAPDAELVGRVKALESEMDEFRFVGRELYWLIQGRMSESPLFRGGGLEKATRGHATTMRNSTTVRKITTRLREP